MGLKYEEDKGAYIFIVVLIVIVTMGIISFLPFLLIGAVLLLAVGGVLHVFGKAGDAWDKHVTPKVDDFINEDKDN